MLLPNGFVNGLTSTQPNLQENINLALSNPQSLYQQVGFNVLAQPQQLQAQQMSQPIVQQLPQTLPQPAPSLQALQQLAQIQSQLQQYQQLSQQQQLSQPQQHPRIKDSMNIKQI